MDLQVAPGDRPDGGGAGFFETIMLGAVRLASLPFLFLVIAITALAYGIAILVRSVILVVGRLPSPGRAARHWDRPVKAQDA